MKQVEILAPAGSIESLYASLNMGADAVYVGTSRFGARAFAQNPSVDELQEALLYAHLKEKKIYLTVNTLLNEHELKNDLYDMIAPLYEKGLDACIVQDLGVLKFLHESFPGMDLHASTQMTIFSGEEANLFKRYGVTRYVPARELSIEEIRQARSQTDLEIEVFVHGALCYCYSGQCLLSEVIGGRSGNRGMCAQPCRLPYKTPYGDGYLFSTKDSCTLFQIPELIESGIDSFKIEGRMKKVEYSAFLAYVYRKYTDYYLTNGKEAFQMLAEDPDSPLWQDYVRCQDLYNRGGFSKSFLFEKDKQNMIDTKRNNHYGSLVGTVSKADRYQPTVELQKDISYQDVLEFRDEDGNSCYEYTVKDPAKKGHTIRPKVLPDSHIYAGQKLYRTRNQDLLNWIQTKMQESKEDIPLTGSFSAHLGEPMKLTLQAKDVEVSCEGQEVTGAVKKAATKEDVQKAVCSLGNTWYCMDSLTCSIDLDVFLPVGALKKLRRDAIDKWQEAFGRAYIKDHRMKRTAGLDAMTEVPAKEEIKEKTLVSVTGLEQLRTVLEVAGSSAMIHLKLEDFPCQDLPEAARLLQKTDIAISFPRVLRGKGKENFLKDWEQWGGSLRPLVSAVLVNSHAMYLYAKKFWPDACLLADENLYQMNSMATQVYEEFGLQKGPDIVYGRQAVMVTESCLAKTLKRCGKGDQQIPVKAPKGDRFIVCTHCRYCYNTVYTKDARKGQGKSENWRRIDFTFEENKEVREVLRQWI